MEHFTIRDLENLSGIKGHTIRMWEQRYGFLRPRRTESNIRYYDCAELKKLRNVALLLRNGYRISQINRMSPGQMHERVLALREAPACHERRITELIEAMVKADALRFEALLDEGVCALGMDKAIPGLLLPFLEQAALLWTTDRINAAQEQLVTALIRQKIIAAIDAQPAPTKGKRSPVMLFLPEGEYHEPELLFVHYLLRARGRCSLYLGPNIPPAQAALLLEARRPAAVCVHLHAVRGNFSFPRFLRDMHDHFSGIPVILTGPMTAGLPPGLPAGIRVLPSGPGMGAWVRSL